MKNTQASTERLASMRLVGEGPARRVLESLVNQGVLEVSEASALWREAFGGRLVALTARTVEVSQ
jgi:hypothetical protein